MTSGHRQVIATIGTGPMRSVLELGMRSYVRFAEAHGYDVVVGSGESDGRPASWGKVLLLRELAERYDRVVWIDSDIFIRDWSEDLPALPDGALIGLVEHVDPPEWGRIPNCGMLVLRGGPETIAFLDEVWAKSEYADHRWWEQAAVMELLGYPTTDFPTASTQPSRWRDRVAYLEPKWNVLHAWPWPDDPRMLHLAGMPNAERRFLMRLELWRAEGGLRAALHAPGVAWFRLRRAIRVRVLRRG